MASAITTMRASAAALVDRFKSSRPGRALARYAMARGALLAGGIAYTGLFSVFSALAIGVTILMGLLGSRPALRDRVLDQIGQALPGVIDTGSGGLVTVDQLTLGSALNIGSLAAGGFLLYSAVALMGVLKTALRAMFGIARLPENPLRAWAWNLVALLVMMAGVLATATASALTTALAGSTAGLIGLPAWLSGAGTHVVAVVISFLIDAAVLALLLAACGIRVPRKDLAEGVCLGAVAFGALREIGSRAVGSNWHNPLLASFTAIVILILWLHLASRILLIVAAWIANPPRPTLIEHPDEVHARARPNYVTLSVPATLSWPRQSLTGTVEVDPTEHPDYLPPAPPGGRARWRPRARRARPAGTRLRRADPR
ncbi:PE-PGRS family protein [Actinomyces denticolens]|uniref:YihY/virulence factor BrkB family protein n=1 Tax=Actinomyces denticolens TaxID=52767 RepID=UPI0009C700CE|nr:YihY/virulence factor BrkB family protein [Actinomyces denticolens]GAV94436.1 PE-PGRS family protein [Actinomyces denticolens]